MLATLNQICVRSRIRSLHTLDQVAMHPADASINSLHANLHHNRLYLVIRHLRIGQTSKAMYEVFELKASPSAEFERSND
jgi:hypothetical protein